MKKIIKYQSERGPQFDTPEEAIEFDNALPRIIKSYKNEFLKMKKTGEFAGKKVNEEDIENWKEAIKEFEENWERAQKSL